MGDGTTIGKVRGLGSSGEGSEHWLHQRYTALANLFLGAWFVASIVLMRGNLGLEAVGEWLSGPIPGTAMVLLIVSTFYHARLGLQVVLEDYVKDEGTRIGLVAVLNLVAIGAATFGIFCVLKLAFVPGGSLV
jgi:succinate dehydrogenase / fumarate reductase membrane anchor subunit